MRASHVFRAVWPIKDDDPQPYHLLIRQASDDLPTLLTQAAAQQVGMGRFSVALSTQVPGSGRVSESVLVYEAPVIQTPPRPYRNQVAVP